MRARRFIGGRGGFAGFLLSERRKKAAAAFLAAALLIAAAAAFSAKLRPLVSGMAEASAKNLVTLAVNEAVTQKMTEGVMDYSDLIALEKDAAGTVSALVTNMVYINALQSEITSSIIEKLRGGNYSEFSIPIGNIIGGNLLSGRGPAIKVKIISVSYAKAMFRNNFTTSGINQTRHQIILEATVTVNILAPGAHTAVAVTTEMLVAETVIVGKVPDSYTYFEGDGKWDENLERYDILN